MKKYLVFGFLLFCIVKSGYSNSLHYNLSKSDIIDSLGIWFIEYKLDTINYYINNGYKELLPIKKAIDEFYHGTYKNALNELQNLNTEVEQSFISKYLKALILLNLKEYEQANNIALQVISLDETKLNYNKQLLAYDILMLSSYKTKNISKYNFYKEKADFLEPFVTNTCKFYHTYKLYQSNFYDLNTNDFYKELLTFSEFVTNSQNPIIQLTYNFSLACAYYEKFNYTKSLQAYYKCIGIVNNNSLNNEYLLADSYYGLAYLYKIEDNPLKYQYLGKTKDLYQSTDTNRYIKVLLDYIEKYSLDQQFDSSYAYLEHAEKTINQYKNASAEVKLSTYHSLYKYFTKVDKQRRMEYALKFIKLYEEQLPIDNTYKHKYNLLKAYYAVTNNNLREALQYYRDDISIFHNEPYGQDIYSIDTELNMIFHGYIGYSLESLAYYFYLYYERETHNIKDLKASLYYYMLSAEYFEKRREEIQSLKNQYSSRVLERRKILNVLEVALDVYEKTHNKKYLDIAFEYCERSREKVLTDYLQIDLLEFASNIPHKLIQQRDSLTKEIDKYRILLSKIQDDARTISINDDLSNLIKEKDIVQSHIDKLINKNKQDNKFITISEVQLELEADDIVLEYAIKPSELYVFAITKDEVKYFRRKNVQGLIDTVNFFRHCIDKPDYDYNLQEYKNMIEYGNHLYNSLVSPFNNLLADKKHIFFVAEDVLSFIPLNIILTDTIASSYVDYTSLNYLFKSYQTTNGLSSALLFNNKSKLRLNKILAVSPNYPVKYTYLKDTEFLKTINNLPPLPGARKETELLISDYKAKGLLGVMANEKTFNSICDKYDVIHLSMHSLIDLDDPDQSALVFSNIPTKENNNLDGLLYNYEIVYQNLKTPLIVLNSCNTGTGKLIRGEGILSQAKAFFMAGASSVITTMWDQDDETGYLIIKEFYSNLFKSMPVNTALSKAKKTYINSCDPLKSHPFYWASYIAYGDPKIKNTSKTSTVILISVLLVLGFVLLMIFHKKRLSKK